MLRNYIRQLLAFIFIIASIYANGQGFGVSTSARYGDGCRLDFYNSTNVKIFSLRGSELRYTYNSSGQIIVRDENTQITDLFGISGLAALIDSVQSVCLAGLCGGSTPVENFAYCGAPVPNYWSCSDTTNLIEGYCFYNNLFYELDSNYYQFFIEAQNSASYPFGIFSFTNYLFNEAPNINGSIGTCDDSVNFEGIWNNCAFVNTFSLNFKDFAILFDDNCAFYDSINYGGLILKDTLINYINTILINNGTDSTLIQDAVLDFNVGAPSFSQSFRRVLGVNINDIDLNTTSGTITITAKPVKTSGTTYAASSFKIEKIAFADITAGTISGSSYNPNSGEQSNTFALTTGKNTFKVSVEDTDGNIAYSIFQLTKTAL